MGECVGRECLPLVHHRAKRDAAGAALRAGNGSLGVGDSSLRGLSVSFRRRRGGFGWKKGREQTAPLGKRYLARAEPVPADGAEVGGPQFLLIFLSHHYTARKSAKNIMTKSFSVFAPGIA